MIRPPFHRAALAGLMTTLVMALAGLGTAVPAEAAAVVSQPDSKTVTTKTPITVNVLTNDTGQGLRLTAVGNEGPSGPLLAMRWDLCSDDGFCASTYGLPTGMAEPTLDYGDVGDVTIDFADDWTLPAWVIPAPGGKMYRVATVGYQSADEDGATGGSTLTVRELAGAWDASGNPIPPEEPPLASPTITGVTRSGGVVTVTGTGLDRVTLIESDSTPPFPIPFTRTDGTTITITASPSDPALEAKAVYGSAPEAFVRFRIPAHMGPVGPTSDDPTTPQVPLVAHDDTIRLPAGATQIPLNVLTNDECRRPVGFEGCFRPDGVTYLDVVLDTSAVPDGVEVGKSQFGPIRVGVPGLRYSGPRTFPIGYRIDTGEPARADGTDAATVIVTVLPGVKARTDRVKVRRGKAKRVKVLVNDRFFGPPHIAVVKKSLQKGVSAKVKGTRVVLVVHSRAKRVRVEYTLTDLTGHPVPGIIRARVHPSSR